MKLLALCTNLPDVCTETFKDQRILAKYPGSGAIPYLERYAKWVGYTLISGREALPILDKGWAKPRDVYVLQEEFNEYGPKLIERGCVPFLSLCLESPLYLPQFYVNPPQGFEFEMSFRKFDYHNNRDEPLGCAAFFPSFDADEVIPNEDWKYRKLLCAVVSNKYPTGNDSSDLRPLRYKAIEFFKPFMDLYGKGWPWGYGNEIPPGEKVKVMRDYQYSLCFENYTMPGYITEKILDCFVAGVVPIYFGAPDIGTYIPKNLYIHLKDDGALSDLLADMKNGVGKEKPALAKEWLKSQDGFRYSYQAFARRIVDLLP